MRLGQLDELVLCLTVSCGCWQVQYAKTSSMAYEKVQRTMLLKELAAYWIILGHMLA